MDSPEDGDSTAIVFQNGNAIFVAETPEQIYGLIDYAKWREDKNV